MCVDIFHFAADAPIAHDCMDLYVDHGRKSTGNYFIDPTYPYTLGNARETYCKEGWTYLLRRGRNENNLFVSWFYFSMGKNIRKINP